MIMMMADGSKYDEDDFHISLIQFTSCLWQTLKARQKNNTIRKCLLSYNQFLIKPYRRPGFLGRGLESKNMKRFPNSVYYFSIFFFKENKNDLNFNLMNHPISLNITNIKMKVAK